MPAPFTLDEISMLMGLACTILGLALPIFFIALDERLTARHNDHSYVELRGVSADDMYGSRQVPGTYTPDGNLRTARHNVAEETVSFLAQIRGNNADGYEYSASEIADFVHLRRGDALELVRRIRL